MPLSEGLSSRGVFQFENVVSLQINNSRFLNLQNASIVTYSSSHQNALSFFVGFVYLTFSNITVANNTINIQDGAVDRANLFSFQNDALNYFIIVDFIDSHFKDNKVTTSTIIISKANQINLQLKNNTFRNNVGSYGSAILSIINLYDTVQLWVGDNKFQDNLSLQKGGVFSIIASSPNITLLNNVYINNSAQQGGVGYTILENVGYYEDNGTYIGNIISQLSVSLIQI